MTAQKTAKKTTAKKTTTTKVPSRKTATKKTASSKKAVAKKTPVKKKTATKKAAAKKTPVKKKTAAKKKTPAKKKTATKKTTAKKAPAKKARVRTSPKQHNIAVEAVPEWVEARPMAVHSITLKQISANTQVPDRVTPERSGEEGFASWVVGQVQRLYRFFAGSTELSGDQLVRRSQYLSGSFQPKAL